MSSRSVAQTVYAAEQGEGVGVTVRRSIGTERLRNISPFLMLDHFKIGEGSGFSEHPHRGQATVTYMLEGTVEHEDFKGHQGFINPGDVQWMQAARGMVHSEMPVHGPGKPDPIGLQLWLDLPAANKMDQPDYQEYKNEEMPHVHPSDDVEIKIISGKARDAKDGLVESPVKPKGGCWYLDVKLQNKGSKITQDLPSSWNSFAYILEGSVTFGHSKPQPRYNTAVLTKNANETSVAIEAVSEGGARLVLIAGEPLDQPVVQYGPFVMDSKAKIQQAFMDYSTSSNGFEGAQDWKSESAKRLR